MIPARYVAWAFGVIGYVGSLLVLWQIISVTVLALALSAPNVAQLGSYLVALYRQRRRVRRGVAWAMEHTPAEWVRS